MLPHNVAVSFSDPSQLGRTVAVHSSAPAKSASLFFSPWALYKIIFAQDFHRQSDPFLGLKSIWNLFRWTATSVALSSITTWLRTLSSPGIREPQWQVGSTLAGSPFVSIAIIVTNVGFLVHYVLSTFCDLETCVWKQWNFFVMSICDIFAEWQSRITICCWMERSVISVYYWWHILTREKLIVTTKVQRLDNLFTPLFE